MIRGAMDYRLRYHILQGEGDSCSWVVFTESGEEIATGIEDSQTKARAAAMRASVNWWANPNIGWKY